MKILFIIQGLSSGGAERVMSLLCNSLSEKGYEILLGLTERTDVISYKLDNRIRLLDLRCKSKSAVGFFLNSSKTIHKSIIKQKPDVVVSFITRANICSILGSIGTGVPVIVSERNNPQIDPPSKITRTIRRFVYPLAKGYVFQTTFAMNCFGRSIRKKSIVIYNPVDDKKITIVQTERQNRVIAVGRLEAQKNFPLLINAFADVMKVRNDYKLDIYGEGSLHDELQCQIDQLGLKKAITLKGHTSNTFTELATSKIFVLSSDYEGMPNALMEAMCMGCACITTDAPAYGARELMRDGISGYLIPVGDKKALTEKLLSLMDNESLLRSMSHEASKVRELVNQDIIVSKWLEYINNIVTR